MRKQARSGTCMARAAPAPEVHAEEDVGGPRLLRRVRVLGLWLEVAARLGRGGRSGRAHLGVIPARDVRSVVNSTSAMPHSPAIWAYPVQHVHTDFFWGTQLAVQAPPNAEHAGKAAAAVPAAAPHQQAQGRREVRAFAHDKRWPPHPRPRAPHRAPGPSRARPVPPRHPRRTRPAPSHRSRSAAASASAPARSASPARAHWHASMRASSSSPTPGLACAAACQCRAEYASWPARARARVGVGYSIG